ncbi:MCE family protein [Jatrophihabitans telluris]|uniref:MCE family protein n=1 Tax=Jatrophihabitans telluris TaxID=2038343 RepID=A0ABY4QYM6_9ACTN|nr:MCE family protein [Jatrophihabitans telluris]UQX88020.1 MCE family protein [Jatrophihabitans telluris]
MARQSRAWRIRRRLYGLVFMAVLVGLIGLSIAAYQQVFTKVTLVTLDTDHTGAQLMPQSDVKLRGIIVGSVRSISTYNVPAAGGRQPLTRARLTLALQPGRTDLIPAGATALLLPKTLFGERYVSLQIPDGLSGTSAQPIRSGDTITSAKDAVEVEQVLNDLYPVLLALHPEDLKATLTAVASALQGRGKQLGDNLASLNDYLTKLNPKVPQLVDDIDKLGRVATLYNDAAPDLLSSLNNLSVTATTIARRPQALAQLLISATATSDTVDGFLNDNGNYLISVASSSKQIVGLLAHYAPEYPCLLSGLAGIEPRLEDAFGGKQPGLHITLEVIKSQGKYVAADRFRYPTSSAVRQPHCFGLPAPANPFPGVDFGSAGSPDGAAYNPPQGLGSADRAAYNAAGVGSPAEENLVAGLIAPSWGGDPTKVPSVAALLAAPLLRGSQVTVG